MSDDGKLIVHLVGNAHLDPVWLWLKASGVDESLATCRTACDLLDEYKDLHITRGEAWVYRQVADHDPELFARLAEHVKNGRWHLVNGWMIQADCNLPTEASFRQQGKMGQALFESWFGKRARVGYNVDSFGHTAMIPDFLQGAGMDYYVFQRPGPHEKMLPAEHFRWVAPTGKEVLAARLTHGYATWSIGDLEWKVKTTLQIADRSLGHVMLFYGVGDHGGGPTREQVEWLIRNKDVFPGAELRFSHPEAFFAAIEPHRHRLPIWTNELQFHAIGCYTAARELKSETRRAEELASQASRALAIHSGMAPRDAGKRLDAAWERLLFNQFHDILPGSSIKSACQEALDELGMAKAEFRDVAFHALRRATLRLPGCIDQRLVLHNLSGIHFSGMIENEPNIWGADASRLALAEEDGTPIPHQFIHLESCNPSPFRLLFKLDMKPDEVRSIRIQRNAQPVKPDRGVWADVNRLRNNAGVSARTDGAGLCEWNMDSPLPGAAADANPPGAMLTGLGLRMEVLEDYSDTWSHGLDRFRGRVAGILKTDHPWVTWDDGPLRTSLANNFHWGRSWAQCLLILDAGDPWLHLQLRVYWNDPHRVLKLRLTPSAPWVQRLDLAPGAALPRELDGKEYPFHGWTRLSAPGREMAVATRDAYGIDVAPDGELGLTLLRSPVYSHHDPSGLPIHHMWPVTGLGENLFRLSFLAGAAISDELVNSEAVRQTNPIWATETTKGMPPR